MIGKDFILFENGLTKRGVPLFVTWSKRSQMEKLESVELQNLQLVPSLQRPDGG